jgi:hypothetical protein
MLLFGIFILGGGLSAAQLNREANMGIIKITKRIAIIISAFVGFLILVLICIALWLQFEYGYTPKIKGENSIASLEQIQLGHFKNLTANKGWCFMPG